MTEPNVPPAREPFAVQRLKASITQPKFVTEGVRRKWTRRDQLIITALSYWQGMSAVCRDFGIDAKIIYRWRKDHPTGFGHVPELNGLESTARKPADRTWSTAEKRKIVEESFRPGVTTASVAREHGVAVQTLYLWRSCHGEPAESPNCSNEVVAPLLSDAPDSAPAPYTLTAPKDQLQEFQLIIGQQAIEIARLKAELQASCR